MQKRKKVTVDACDAFNERRRFKRGNTEVIVEVVTPEITQVSMFLFGNLIATNYYNGEKGLFICDGGWQSVTTKERLNGLPNVSVQQKNSHWFLNGESWDGSMVDVLKRS